MICNDCIKRSTLEGSGIIQFCYTHQHAKEMKDMLEEFVLKMDRLSHIECAIEYQSDPNLSLDLLADKVKELLYA